MEPTNGYQDQYVASGLILCYDLDDFNLSTLSPIMSAAFVNTLCLPSILLAELLILLQCSYLSKWYKLTGLSVDWKVGLQLWKNITKELKKQVSEVRNQYLPSNSGGDSYYNKINMKTKDYGNKNAIQYPTPGKLKDGTEKSSIENEDTKTFLLSINETRYVVNDNISYQAHPQ